MSRVQRFLTLVLPQSWAESMEHESRQWIMECANCHFAQSVWDAGGIRCKASGHPRVRRRCPNCGEFHWYTISKQTADTGQEDTLNRDCLIAAGFLVVAIIGCGGSTVLPPPQGEIISECFFHATATVWEDANGDGVRDSGERPLSNVSVNTYHTGRDEPLMEGQTNADGVSSFGAISTVCDWENYSVRMLVPGGYTSTTPVELTFAEIGDGGTASFGIVPDEGN